jgi:tRNA threonylcarbamoyladenosine biosynthesis protein TsaB
MICLGLDTSGKRAEVAVVDGARALCSRSSDPTKTHSETLLVITRDALNDAGIVPRDVDLVAVGLGPGAWTGLRMGVTTAKALAFALGVPIVGISSLEAIAAGVEGYSGRLLVVADARRGELCGAFFEIDGRGGVRGDGRVFTFSPADTGRIVSEDLALAGNGISLLPEGLLGGRRVFPERDGEPHAVVLCKLAIARFEERGGDDPAAVLPIYVRRSDAEINREKKEKTAKDIC